MYSWFWCTMAVAILVSDGMACNKESVKWSLCLLSLVVLNHYISVGNPPPTHTHTDTHVADLLQSEISVNYATCLKSNCNKSDMTGKHELGQYITIHYNRISVVN